MQDYRKLKVWEKAHQLVLTTYRATKDFPKDELYGVTSQLRRAATSISANIVEGSGRKTRPDFARFLTISLGSTNEVEYFLLLSKDLQYLSEAHYTQLTEQVTEVRKMLLSLENRILTATNRRS
jgi:four helix bundle protein